jgi:hypothetical protein
VAAAVILAYFRRCGDEPSPWLICAFCAACAVSTQVLELEFSVRKGPARGLREVTREQWDLVLGDAKCSILCTMSNDHFDSYVLSESSLFVYPHTALLKTCGTTTLLRCIPRLLEYTAVGSEACRSPVLFPLDPLAFAGPGHGA